jgi:mersacidin/lichenicidin family type 2 lantibiotic
MNDEVSRRKLLIAGVLAAGASAGAKSASAQSTEDGFGDSDNPLLLKPEDPDFNAEYIEKVLRYWKDPEFARSLSREERARLPNSPAGPMMNLVAEIGPEEVPWFTIIIATMLLTCGLCHTAPRTCGHGGCQD